MANQINWAEAGVYFLQQGIWQLSSFQGDVESVSEFLRFSAIEQTEIRSFEEKPNLSLSVVAPVIPELKLWDTPWKYSDQTNEGVEVDKRLVMVAPTPEIAAEGAYAYDHEYPLDPERLVERKNFFTAAKIHSLVTTGKMPSITNTLLFCYYEPRSKRWVTPLEIVTI